MEDQQDKKLKQEAEAHEHEIGDIKALIQEQKQMQEHSTAELGLLYGDLGELQDKLNT